MGALGDLRRSVLDRIWGREEKGPEDARSGPTTTGAENGRVGGATPASATLDAHPGCVFCEIVAGRSPAKIVYEDEHYLAFEDKWPAAATHVQVIPKQHIRDINSLTTADAGMVRDLYRIGRKIVGADGAAGGDGIAAGRGLGGEGAAGVGASPGPCEWLRFGFHVPPFISVSHLHMHAIHGPFKPKIFRAKFSPRAPLWFLTVDRWMEQHGVGLEGGPA